MQKRKRYQLVTKNAIYDTCHIEDTSSNPLRVSYKKQSRSGFGFVEELVPLSGVVKLTEYTD